MGQPDGDIGPLKTSPGQAIVPIGSEERCETGFWGKKGRGVEFTLTLNWEDSEPVTPANVVLMQGVGDEVILSFGHATPPAVTAAMTEEEKITYFNDHTVKVAHINRVVVSVIVAKRLLELLQLNLGNAEEEESTP